MRETLVVHLGSLGGEAESKLAEALNAEPRTLKISGPNEPAARRTPRETVLLASSAVNGGDGRTPFLITGAFLGSALDANGTPTVRFGDYRPFVVPLVLSDTTGAFCRELTSEGKFWSASSFYWFPYDFADACVKKADELVSLVRGTCLAHIV